MLARPNESSAPLLPTPTLRGRGPFLLPAGGGSAGSSLLRTPTCAFLGTGPTGLPSPPRVEISGRDRAPQLPLPVPPAVPQQHAFLLQPSPTAGTVTPDKADSEHEPKKKKKTKKQPNQTNKQKTQTNKQTKKNTQNNSNNNIINPPSFRAVS